MEPTTTVNSSCTNRVPPHLLKTSPYVYKPSLQFSNKVNFEAPFVQTPMLSQRQLSQLSSKNISPMTGKAHRDVHANSVFAACVSPLRKFGCTAGSKQ